MKNPVKMPRTFLKFISLKADCYLEDKFIEICFPDTQTFLLGGTGLRLVLVG